MRMDLTVYSNEPLRKRLTLTGLDVQAKVFRKFDDAGSLLSKKTVEDGLEVLEPGNGRIRIQLTKNDLAEARPIFVAIFVEGAMVDLFGNEVTDSPL